MKKTALLLFLLPMLLPTRAWAEEHTEYERETRESIERGIDEVLESLDLTELEQLYRETQISEETDFSEMLADIGTNGISTLSIERVCNALLAEAGAGLRKNVHYLAEILAVLLVTGILGRLPSAGSGAARAAARTGYLIVCGIAVGMLLGCFREGRTALTQFIRIVEVLTPILLVLLTGMGGLVGSSVMSPVMAALTGSIFSIVEELLFPLMIAGAALSAVSCVSDAVRLDKLAAFAGSLVKWALGILFTVFLGVSAMKGIAGASADGVYFRTAKYTIDRLVPVIGGMFSDTLDTIMACSLLVKNAVGFMGLIILVGMMTTPLVTIGVTMLLFRAGAALAEPFADTRAVRLMECMGKTAELAWIVVLTCAAMVFISIALMMGTADMSMMTR